MSWKNLLTKIANKAKALVGTKSERIGANRGRKPDNEAFAPSVSVEEAVSAIPKDLIDDLKNYRSVKFNNAKLDESQQLELMEFIARFATMDDINEHFFGKYKITLTQTLIYQYRRTKKWQPVIEKLREKYLLAPSEVAMSHKRVRLDRRERIYHKAIKKDDLKTALKSVDSSRDEMEESGRGGVSLTFNQFNTLSDDEIAEKKRELLERLKKSDAIDIKQENTNGLRGE